ncbi:hypothetical protein BH24CHL7_BH24CHL7_14130 [soil metagenome]
MAQSRGTPDPARSNKKAERSGKRTYRSRGVDVEIDESVEQVQLRLDGHPIDVEFIDGEYFSQTANMFTSFGSVEEVADTLLANEGRTWTLHGHVCDESCGPEGHHHGPGEGAGHDHGSGHDHGGHGHGS